MQNCALKLNSQVNNKILPKKVISNCSYLVAKGALTASYYLDLSAYRHLDLSVLHLGFIVKQCPEADYRPCPCPI